ncbi:hypothetical protein JCM14469_30850 [Desulfatiferula olefinivorans]
MKKRIVTLVLLSSLGFCPSLSAMFLMTDSELQSAVGQAGVSLQFDHIYYEQTVGSIAYTDDNGTTGEPGTVEISDTHMIKIYDGIISAADYAAKFQAATGVAPWAAWDKFSPLVIDVGTCSTLSAIVDNNLATLTLSERSAIIDAVTMSPDLESAAELLVSTGTADAMDEATTFVKAFQSVTDPNAPIPSQTFTGVVAGLPTLMINTSFEEFDVGVAKEGAINDGKKFIRVKREANVMVILSGTAEVAAH